jgi:Zn ribbon nucleic-acid-binding protein
MINASQKRYHASQTSFVMKRLAIANQCPKCHRKAALKWIYPKGTKIEIVKCRWKDCGYCKEEAF